MSATTDDGREEGVEFVFEADGRVTTQDIEIGVASYGDTKAEALAVLAEALTLHEGGGEPVTSADLREVGPGPEDFEDEGLPEFMR